MLNNLQALICHKTPSDQPEIFESKFNKPEPADKTLTALTVGLRTRCLYPLKRGKTLAQQKGCLEYDINLYPVMRLQSCSSGSLESILPCHYFQDHSAPVVTVPSIV